MLKFVVIFSAFFAGFLALPTEFVSYEDEHAEELENAFQGDMIISQEELDAFNGRIDVNLRWKNNIVPYWINMTYFSEYF